MRQPVQLSPGFVHISGLVDMLPPRSGWTKSTPVSITATVDRARAGRHVPGLVRVDVCVGRAGDAVDRLAGVAQAPELREGGVVRDGARVDSVVLLRVLDARLRGQDLQRVLGRGGIRLRELRVLPAESLRSLRAGRLERALLLGLRRAGLEANDQLARDGVLLRRLAGLARLRARDGRQQEDGQADDERANGVLANAFFLPCVSGATLAS